MEKRNLEIKEWIITFIMTVFLIFVIRTFIFSPVIVDGDSMQPNLHSGDRLFINKIGKYFDDFERSDVIVFKKDRKEHYIKRIIGMPGDEVAFHDHKLFINGKPLKEDYIVEDSSVVDYSIQSLYGYKTVPKGYYFVLGDNRPNSADSRKRFIGLVSEDQILGEVNWIVWPASRIGNINN